MVVIWIGSLSTAFTYLVPNGEIGFRIFFLQRIATGVSVGGSFPLIYSLLGDIFPSEKR